VLEQRRIDLRPMPAVIGECLQGQHAQCREALAAFAQGGVMGRRPLTLPDIKLLIEGGASCARKQRAAALPRSKSKSRTA
jgi:hypothetical protein